MAFTLFANMHVNGLGGPDNMAYLGKVNVLAELRKVREGKKTKVPVGLLLLSATEGYPAIQAQIAKAFGITTYR